MKNSMKIYKVLLLAVLILVVIAGTVGIVFAATTVPTASQTGSLAYVPESGIRYNPGQSCFEIYSYAGLTWMNSGKVISTSGEVNVTAGTTAKAATTSDTYYIMQDIYYQDTVPTAGNSAYSTTYNVSFYGTLDGRGFYLRNFKTKEVLTGTYYHYLSLLNIHVNYGTIRNINIENVTIAGTSTTNSRYIGLLCSNNDEGKIENCTTYGSVSYGNTTNGYVYFGAFTCNNNWLGFINNCTNNLSVDGTKLTTSGFSDVGGICYYSFGITNHCINNGDLKGTGCISGIVAVPGDELTLKDNINNGRIETTGTATWSSACGILSGGYTFVILGDWCSNNINNGEIVGPSGYAYDIFFGYEKGYQDLGIRWNVTSQVFEIYNYKGFTYIGSNENITVNGAVYYWGDYTYKKATLNATYVLMNDIYYDAKTCREYVDNNPFYAETFSGTLDGNGYSLINFETKKVYLDVNSYEDDSVYIDLYYSILFYQVRGTIKNLTIENPKIVWSDSDYIDGYTTYINSIFFGLFAYSLESGIIDNCKTSGTINCGTQKSLGLSFGGFCGVASGTISNSQNGLDINATSIGADSYSSIAGFVYQSSGLNIIDCINKGNITAYQASGFFIYGYDSSSISNCQNFGNITQNIGGGYAAGFICYASGLITLANNINHGEIKSLSANATGYIGGFIAYGGGTIMLNGNKNYGNITTSTSTGYLGGTIGSLGYGTFILRDNINRGIVQGGQYAGGMIGLANSSSSVGLSNNINYGDVKACNYAGGIIGYLGSTTSSNWKPITNNINYGAVTTTVTGSANSFAAGMIGWLYGSYIISATCLITGNINYGVITSGGTSGTTNSSCGISGGNNTTAVSSWTTYASQNYNYGQIYSGTTRRYPIFIMSGTAIATNGGVV